MSPIEILSTVLGVACVWLGVVRSVWTFPTAIGSVALLGVVVWGERLYSDAALQIFFVGANLYGWANWARSRAETGTVVVETMTGAARTGWTIAGIALALAWGTAMARWTDAAFPWWDGGIAVASMIAQLLMAQRRLENWLLWIAVDLASIPLYLAKHLWAFAGLYLVYLALAVWGWSDWRRAHRAAAAHRMAGPAAP